MLLELLDQIPPEQEIATVTADGAFDSRKCHDAIAARGAAAIIPPRKNARPWKPWKPDTAGAVARNEILRTSKRVGRTIWRRWSGYHRRSRAETKMHCVKLLGQRLSARDFDRQVAKFQVRVAILNGFTALGTPSQRSQDRSVRGKGRHAHHPICATEPIEAIHRSFWMLLCEWLHRSASASRPSRQCSSGRWSRPIADGRHRSNRLNSAMRDTF